MITRLTTPRRNKFLNSWPQSSQHQVATSFHQLMTILNTQELNINYICRHWFSFHSSILQLLRRSSFRQLASFWRSFPLLFPFVFAWSEVNISSNKFHNTTCHSGPFITMKWATTSSLVSTRNKFNNNRNYLILLNSQSIDSFSFSTRSSGSSFKPLVNNFTVFLQITCFLSTFSTTFVSRSRTTVILASHWRSIQLNILHCCSSGCRNQMYTCSYKYAFATLP
jgi:hypothetical protein